MCGGIWLNSQVVSCSMPTVKLLKTSHIKIHKRSAGKLLVVSYEWWDWAWLLDRSRGADCLCALDRYHIYINLVWRVNNLSVAGMGKQHGKLENLNIAQGVSLFRGLTYGRPENKTMYSWWQLIFCISGYTNIIYMYKCMCTVYQTVSFDLRQDPITV